jgi:cytoskeletal protein RodZ
MFDLKQISPIFTAKFVGVVTILVFNSACAHELFIRPANNDSVAQELERTTPEPAGHAQASTLSETKTPSNTKAAKHGKHTVAKHAHKAHKNLTVARNTHKRKIHTAAIASVASTQATPPPQAPAAPAPEIAPPQIPAPLASAGVQTEIDADSGGHIGMFVIYGMAALAILGLIYVAPRARRASKPKRKLVYNG